MDPGDQTTPVAPGRGHSPEELRADPLAVSELEALSPTKRGWTWWGKVKTTEIEAQREVQEKAVDRAAAVANRAVTGCTIFGVAVVMAAILIVGILWGAGVGTEGLGLKFHVESKPTGTGGP